MNDKIFLIEGDRVLREMEAQDYPAEERLQRMLVDHPDLLAGYQINQQDPRRWILVKREMGVADVENSANRWSVDHLFLDQDGIPTLVEVKRASNRDIRRAVVGQMLEYAANASRYWSGEELRRVFEMGCVERGEEPNAVIAKFLEPATETENQVESFWQSVEANLQESRLRLLFLADRIPSTLRRIIEFLNKQMVTVEVLGVELRQFVNDDFQAIVPRVVGGTTETENTKAVRKTGRKWNEATFLATLEENSGAEDRRVAEAIIAWARAVGLSDKWGDGTSQGTYLPQHRKPVKGRLSLFAVNTDGGLEFYFEHHKNHEPFKKVDKRLELRDRLNCISGVDIERDAIDRRPSVNLLVFRNEENLTELQEVYSWFRSEIDAAASSETEGPVKNVVITVTESPS